MSKRKPMKPMYRTAAEERLIKAAIAECRFEEVPIDYEGEVRLKRLRNATWEAVVAVVRERKEATK